jgi:hypothetical protein
MQDRFAYTGVEFACRPHGNGHVRRSVASGRSKNATHRDRPDPTDHVPTPSDDRGRRSAIGYFVKRCVSQGHAEYCWGLTFGYGKPNTWQAATPIVPFATIAQAQSVATQCGGYTELAY